MIIVYDPVAFSHGVVTVVVDVEIPAWVPPGIGVSAASRISNPQIAVTEVR